MNKYQELLQVLEKEHQITCEAADKGDLSYVIKLIAMTVTLKSIKKNVVKW